jgi:tungstate transport system permease protein
MILDGFRRALEMLFSLDPDVWGPVWVSLRVACISTVLAALVALPLGLAIGLGRFAGRRVVVSLMNTLLALPTVLVGLVLYGLLSRSGPLGALGILYTPTAMVIGQSVLALPMICAFTVASVERSDPRIRLSMLSLGAGRFRSSMAVALESRAALAAALAAGFGRVFSEVGVAMMVGGNIKGYTRNITTGIAFETGKGEFALGVALGLVLLVVALGVNFAVGYWNYRGGRRQ